MKINKTERKALMQNENYQKYDEKKQKLKNKYPQEVFELEPIGRPKLEYIRYSEKERKLHKDYIKKVADLLFEPSGDYQKFSWDIISDVDKLAMERKSRGRKNYTYE
tara:strand:- start:140 stop:460 length:321 start_codon:yes stop_codon:yes gene_type:complete